MSSTSASSSATISKPALWTARVCVTVVALFLIFDSVAKLIGPAPVLEAFTRLGIPQRLAPTIAVLLFVCLVIYLIPRTAVLGAILLSSYMGGAIAIHLRAGSTPFEMFFPVIMALLLWTPLYLRDQRVRQLIPLRD
jgi:hypothetical protein